MTSISHLEVFTRCDGDVGLEGRADFQSSALANFCRPPALCIQRVQRPGSTNRRSHPQTFGCLNIRGSVLTGSVERNATSSGMLISGIQLSQSHRLAWLQSTGGKSAGTSSQSNLYVSSRRAKINAQETRVLRFRGPVAVPTSLQPSDRDSSVS